VRARLDQVERRAANATTLADGAGKVPEFGDTPTAGRMYRAKPVVSAGETDGLPQLQPARESEAFGKTVAQGGTPPATGENFGVSVSVGAAPIVADLLELQEAPPQKPPTYGFSLLGPKETSVTLGELEAAKPGH